MKLEHLWAFLWLRYRLRVNQVKWAGTLNAILAAILVIVDLVAAVGLFIVGIVVGVLVMPQLTPAVRMYVWDSVVGGFLFCWMLGMLAELQRSEGLAIDKMLHLPVSLAGAFLINYLGSFFSITLSLFIPGMCGLALGQLYPFGPVMLLALPLLAAFVFSATALTYQFQGWLAAMMTNPRRRRTMIVLFTAGFVILIQIPNFLNITRPWDKHLDSSTQKMQEQQEELLRKYQAGSLTAEELSRQTQASIEEAQLAKAAWKKAAGEQAERTTRVVNYCIPPGWVVMGAVGLTEGSVLLSLATMLALTLIGCVSLWSAYRTTLRSYVSGGGGDGRKPGPVVTAREVSQRPRLVEWVFPFVSEYASGVATAGFRSLLRAPETKMLLITPIIMLGGFGGLFVSLSQAPPRLVGPYIPLGILGMMMMAMMQLSGNQFGFDRDGFRALILSPVPRREILLGKNLSLAPPVLVLALIVIVAVGMIFHLRVDQFLAAGVQTITMFMLYCLVANLCSIFAPFAIPSGSLRASRPGMTVLLILMGGMTVSPFVIVLPAVIPVIVETILTEVFEITFWPISLTLSVVILTGVVFLYRAVLSWEGKLLLEREQRILEVVTRTAE
jgi:hypothetical protein